MEVEVFGKGMQEVGKYFNGIYQPIVLEDIWPDCQKEPDDAMRNAYRRIRLEFNSKPTPARVRDLVQEEGRKIREAQIVRREESADAEKGQYAAGTAKAFQADAAVAQRSLLVIRAMIERKITRERALEGVRHLDAEFPAAGFAKAGYRLQDFYKQRNMPLDRICGTSIRGSSDED